MKDWTHCGAARIISDFFGERGRLDRIRRRPADEISRPKLARLLGQSPSALLMIRAEAQRPKHFWRILPAGAACLNEGGSLEMRLRTSPASRQ